MSLIQRLSNRIRMIAARRAPDFVIGKGSDVYLNRWFVIPRNKWFNIYLHEFCRSDDDRALHDHPWFWLSLILDGEYSEHRIRAGGVATRVLRTQGSIRVAAPWTAHRVELTVGRVWTLFITGPRLRVWGFHCPQRWVPWDEFTDPTNAGAVGKGCDQ